ncbi:MAG: hypothetical protein KDH96_12860, partial [Candidatus Riesia sp.]|nr:hypothetical protein [Candidatus Riesia sp.]
MILKTLQEVKQDILNCATKQEVQTIYSLTLLDQDNWEDLDQNYLNLDDIKEMFIGDLESNNNLELLISNYIDSSLKQTDVRSLDFVSNLNQTPIVEKLTLKGRKVSTTYYAKLEDETKDLSKPLVYKTYNDVLDQNQTLIGLNIYIYWFLKSGILSDVFKKVTKQFDPIHAQEYL